MFCNDCKKLSQNARFFILKRHFNVPLFSLSILLFEWFYVVENAKRNQTQEHLLVDSSAAESTLCVIFDPWWWNWSHVAVQNGLIPMY